jgi:hypothetical protein
MTKAKVRLSSFAFMAEVPRQFLEFPEFPWLELKQPREQFNHCVLV